MVALAYVLELTEFIIGTKSIPNFVRKNYQETNITRNRAVNDFHFSGQTLGFFQYSFRS